MIILPVGGMESAVQLPASPSVSEIGTACSARGKREALIAQ